MDLMAMDEMFITSAHVQVYNRFHQWLDCGFVAVFYKAVKQAGHDGVDLLSAMFHLIERKVRIVQVQSNIQVCEINTATLAKYPIKT